MKFVALVSGGKDSIFSALECIRNGHELVACVHLGRPHQVQEESYMYQTAASEVVKVLVEECLGVPLLLHQRVGTSVNTSLVYDNTSPNDEVEDLFLALQAAKTQFPSIQAISSGAILSTYQRVRIEHVCSRLGLTSLSYLWRLAPQKELLQTMLRDGIEAIIVRAACPPGLVPQKHLNKTLRYLWDIGLLERLHQRYQFHVCGEGGEYESLVIDSPLHKRKLVLDQVEIEETEDGVGELKIISCHAEIKTEDDIPIYEFSKVDAEASAPSIPPIQSLSKMLGVPSIVQLPHVRQTTGGLLHFSEIMASVTASGDDATSEATLAVQEAREVLALLDKGLRQFGANAKDVMFVHLYLSEISHFANINAHYQDFFGTLSPPSRSCVAIGKGCLPGGRRVLLDCMVQPGSGEYLRSGDKASMLSSYAMAAHATKTSKLREVLHVQSLSHWAPVCVGPYSQVNTLRSGLHFMAGQIGLIPATMELHPTWNLQLEQCWKNVAAVLDALNGGSLKHLFSGLIYISHQVQSDPQSRTIVEAITKKQLNENGSIIAGRVDSLVDESELYGGYQDQGTWEEMKGECDDADAEKNICPILVVSIPEMPKGALVEVEVVASTETAFKNLDCHDAHFATPCGIVSFKRQSVTKWHTGHEFDQTSEKSNTHIQIDASVRVLGHQCAAMALVQASVKHEEQEVEVQMDALLDDMLLALEKALSEGRSGLGPSDLLHVRLFHVATQRSTTGRIEPLDDGVQLRSTLQRALCKWGDNTALPASTVVPVNYMDLINTEKQIENRYLFLSMQAFFVDPVHLETNIWIHKDREYHASTEAL